MDRLLLIEDDPDIALSLKNYLERTNDYSVSVAPNGEDGLRRALDSPPHLVLLDLNLPGMDGIEVCRKLRESRTTATIPIIMLTARVGEEERIRGLELGADDYVVKPFSIKEVAARIRAALRRARTALTSAQVLEADGLQLDEARRRVRVAGTEVALTRREFDLLSALMRGRGRVWSREQLLERVWGYDHPGATRTVDVHIRQLRKKLGDRAAESIETVVGVGYRFRSED